MRFHSVSRSFSEEHCVSELCFCTCAEQSFHPPTLQKQETRLWANYIQLEPEGGLDGFRGNVKQMAG